jgi:hypothetical protein
VLPNDLICSQRGRQEVSQLQEGKKKKGKGEGEVLTQTAAILSKGPLFPTYLEAKFTPQTPKATSVCGYILY